MRVELQWSLILCVIVTSPRSYPPCIHPLLMPESVPSILSLGDVVIGCDCQRQSQRVIVSDGRLEIAPVQSFITVQACHPHTVTPLMWEDVKYARSEWKCSRGLELIGLFSGRGRLGRVYIGNKYFIISYLCMEIRQERQLCPVPFRFGQNTLKWPQELWWNAEGRRRRLASCFIFIRFSSHVAFERGRWNDLTGGEGRRSRLLILISPFPSPSRIVWDIDKYCQHCDL